MELPEVGEHCALADCSKLDFLPFKCVDCASIFCADHRRPQDHRCVKAEAAEAQRAEAEAERRASAAENGGNVSFSCSFVKVRSRTEIRRGGFSGCWLLLRLLGRKQGSRDISDD